LPCVSIAVAGWMILSSALFPFSNTPDLEDGQKRAQNVIVFRQLFLFLAAAEMFFQKPPKKMNN